MNFQHSFFMARPSFSCFVCVLHCISRNEFEITKCFFLFCFVWETTKVSAFCIELSNLYLTVKLRQKKCIIISSFLRTAE